MDFDETRLYYSHQQLQQQQQPNGDEAGNDAVLRAESGRGGDFEEDTAVDLQAVRRHFREFLRKFRACVIC